ncbi:apolipoprotein N-acyltransferase [Quadrisphaera sp. KR29]|uniref:apolipoprotein N-acyltransferase n=1 Tax=Quadrisphaera sp. KR29 TaxID=3461391 RepID=UPI004043BA12
MAHRRALLGWASSKRKGDDINVLRRHGARGSRTRWSGPAGDRVGGPVAGLVRAFGWTSAPLWSATSLLTGVLVWFLSAPPRSWWWCLPAGSLLVVMGLDGLRGRSRAWSCWVAGWLWATASLWWLTEITVIGYVAASVVIGSLLTLALRLAAPPGRLPRPASRSTTGPGRRVPLGGTGRTTAADLVRDYGALPACMALLEMVLARFPLQGFPLPALSLGQASGPFAVAAAWGGAPLVTLVSVASGVALARVLQTGWAERAGHRAVRVSPAPARTRDHHRTGGRWLLSAGKRSLPSLAVLAAAALVLATPIALGAQVHSQSNGQLHLSLVQGGGPRGLRAVFSDPNQVTQRHLVLAEDLGDDIATGKVPPVDLVLLPENVLSVSGPVASAPQQRRVAALAERLRAAVVVGVVETASTTFRNAAVLWDGEGRIVGRYEKEHRVPFGEYLPARALLSRISSAGTLVPRDALVGVGTAALDVPTARGTVRLGTVISYEGFFADRVREAVQAGGQAILVPTNAASYSYDVVPALQLAAAQLRARESHRTVVQSAPTGYSAIVDADGQIVQTSDLGRAQVLTATVDLHEGQTPYIRWADLPVFAFCLVVMVMVSLRVRLRDSRSAPPAGNPNGESSHGQHQTL